MLPVVAIIYLSFLVSGQPGIKKIFQKYGKNLLYVHYKYDITKKVKIKTAGLKRASNKANSTDARISRGWFAIVRHRNADNISVKTWWEVGDLDSRWNCFRRHLFWHGWVCPKTWWTILIIRCIKKEVWWCPHLKNLIIQK